MVGVETEASPLQIMMSLARGSGAKLAHPRHRLFISEICTLYELQLAQIKYFWEAIVCVWVSIWGLAHGGALVWCFLFHATRHALRIAV